jgi:hypothetical protein
MQAELVHTSNHTGKRGRGKSHGKADESDARRAQFLQSCKSCYKSLRDGTKVGAKPSVGPLLCLEELQGAVELAEQQSATMQQVAPLRAALDEQRELSTEQRKLRSTQLAPDTLPLKGSFCWK